MTGKGIDRRRVIDRNVPPRVVVTDGAGFIGSPLAGSSDYWSGASGSRLRTTARMVYGWRRVMKLGLARAVSKRVCAPSGRGNHTHVA